MRNVSLPRSWLRLSACGAVLLSLGAVVQAAEEPPHSAELDAAIVREAKRHGVPERLVRRIVMRESRYNPRARNHSYWGLMQISYPTARSMGFHGTPEDLLNPLVNLTYAVPYLANAFVIAGKREDAAVRLYASGYYDTARHRGLLGLLRTADSAPLAAIPDAPPPVVVAEASPFGGLFGSSPEPTPAPAPAQDGAQLAYAEPSAAVSPAQAQIQAVMPVGRPAPTRAPRAATDTTKTDADGEVAMVADATGQPELPKKWLHDGGTTVIARGEQAVENVAAFAQSSGGDARGSRRASARHSRKITTFAELEALPQQASQAVAVAPASPEANAAQVATAAAAAPLADTGGDAAPEPKHRVHGRHTHAHKGSTTAIAAAAPPPDLRTTPTP